MTKMDLIGAYSGEVSDGEGAAPDTFRAPSAIADTAPEVLSRYPPCQHARLTHGVVLHCGACAALMTSCDHVTCSSPGGRVCLRACGQQGRGSLQRAAPAGRHRQENILQPSGRAAACASLRCGKASCCMLACAGVSVEQTYLRLSGVFCQSTQDVAVQTTRRAFASIHQGRCSGGFQKPPVRVCGGRALVGVPL